MSFKQVNGQYTNTEDMLKVYSADGKKWLEFESGIKVSISDSEYTALTNVFKPINSEYVNADKIFKVYSQNGYWLEFDSGLKISITEANYNAIIAESGGTITPASLAEKMEGDIGCSVDLNEAQTKVVVGLDLTGGVAGNVLKINSAGTDVEWGTGGIDATTLSSYIQGSVGVVAGLNQANTKVDVHLDTTGATPGEFLKYGSSGPVWGSPVTGTNDGSNWTSLSVQTSSGLQTYNIPSGGSLTKYVFHFSDSTADLTKLFNIYKNAKSITGSYIRYYVTGDSGSVAYSVSNGAIIYGMEGSSWELDLNGIYVDGSTVHNWKIATTQNGIAYKYISRDNAVSNVMTLYPGDDDYVGEIVYWNDSQLH